MKRRNNPISSPISLGGRDQFSELKEKIVTDLDADLAGGAHGSAQRFDAAPVPFHARQARAPPPSVRCHP